jgi:CRP-like cAMP-binding protein
VRNQLLAALGASVLSELKPHFETVHIARPTALFGEAGSVGHVYFPENAVVSFENTLRAGRTVEETAVGREGMAGLSVFLNGYGSLVHAFAQVPGVARRMDARTFRRLSAAPGPLHQVMLRYTQAFLAQVTQTVTCSSMHLLQERCAGWLLLTQERVDATAFPFTHELLATMLGARRAGVTLAIRSFQERELISFARGRLEIVDAAGLERESCECHRTVRAEYARLLPAAA